jgi:glycine/D-amino acid oxidase-like deaminating enzyme
MLCKDVWFSRKVECAGPQQPSSALVVGAGIAGLTAAYHLARANVAVTVLEASPRAGGKMVSYERGRSPVEHSTRVYGASYAALFDMLRHVQKDGESVLHSLVRMDFDMQLFRDGKLREHVVQRRPIMQIEAMQQFGMSSADIEAYLRINKAFADMTEPERRAATWGKSYADYCDWPSRSEAFRAFVTASIGIIVAARPEADAYSILSLAQAATAPRVEPSLRAAFPNLGLFNAATAPTSEAIVDPLLQHLRAAGVRFHFDTEVTALDLSDGRCFGCSAGDRHYSADALVLATPHFTVSALLPNVLPPGLLHNEWSFGVQFYVRSCCWHAVQDLARGAVYQFVTGSPWELVFVLELSELGARKTGRKGFWAPRDMGDDVYATLSATVSNQYRAGHKIQKPLLACDPDELLREVLHQVGVTDEAATRMMASTASLGSALYERAAPDRANFLYGPVHSNGFRWASDATLNIAMPRQPQISTRGICSQTNELREPASCTSSAWLPADALARHAPPFFFRQAPGRLYLAGEYVSGPSLTVPTMERAAASGALAAQALLFDLGSAHRVSGLDYADYVLFQQEPALGYTLRHLHPLWFVLGILLVLALIVALALALMRAR